MVSVLMECRDQEEPLARSLAALVPGAVQGLVREVLVIDLGSRDGSRRVADAAGCTFLTGTGFAAALSMVRSDWIFLIEAGARPLGDWIGGLADHVRANGPPVRLSPPARRWPSLFARLGGAGHGVRHGLLMRRDAALAGVREGETLPGFARRIRARRLACAIAPAGTD